MFQKNIRPDKLLFILAVTVIVLNPLNLTNYQLQKQALASQSESKNTQVKKINRKWMKRVVQSFVKYALNDKSLKTFARGKDVTMQFTLSDMELRFYLRFRHGNVTGKLSSPPELAEVRMEMEARIFDKIFSEQLNATYAAITGDLSFEGDTWKAFTLKRINNDLFRLYAMAIEKEGTSGKFFTASPGK